MGEGLILKTNCILCGACIKLEQGDTSKLHEHLVKDHFVSVNIQFMISLHFSSKDEKTEMKELCEARSDKNKLAIKNQKEFNFAVPAVPPKASSRRSGNFGSIPSAPHKGLPAPSASGFWSASSSPENPAPQTSSNGSGSSSNTGANPRPLPRAISARGSSFQPTTSSSSRRRTIGVFPIGGGNPSTSINTATPSSPSTILSSTPSSNPLVLSPSASFLAPCPTGSISVSSPGGGAPGTTSTPSRDPSETSSSKKDNPPFVNVANKIQYWEHCKSPNRGGPPRSREAEDVVDTNVNDTISNFDALYDEVASKRRGMGQKKDTITRFDEIYRSSTPSNESGRPLSLTGSDEGSTPLSSMERLDVGDEHEDCEDDVFEDGEVTLGGEAKEDPEVTIGSHVTNSGNVANEDEVEVDGAVGGVGYVGSGICVQGCGQQVCGHNRYNPGDFETVNMFNLSEDDEEVSALTSNMSPNNPRARPVLAEIQINRIPDRQYNPDSPETDYKCNWCGRYFKFLTNLKDHIQGKKGCPARQKARRAQLQDKQDSL